MVTNQKSECEERPRQISLLQVTTKQSSTERIIGVKELRVKEYQT